MTRTAIRAMRPREWGNLVRLGARSYKCGYCGKIVAPDIGYGCNYSDAIYICGNCQNPTYFSSDEEHPQVPSVTYGNDVEHLPREVEKLYREARNCVSADSFTAAVLVCRKILLHLSFDKGGPQNQTFAECVGYLASKGYIPPDGKTWVDSIRQKGNEANHEIKLMSREDSEELISFLEMLLKFIYEFPKRMSNKIKLKDPPKS